MARYIKCIIVFVLILLISSNAYAIGDGNIDSVVEVCRKVRARIISGQWEMKG